MQPVPTVLGEKLNDSRNSGEAIGNEVMLTGPDFLVEHSFEQGLDSR